MEDLADLESALPGLVEEELLRMTTVDRDQYVPEAISLVSNEMRRRNLPEPTLERYEQLRSERVARESGAGQGRRASWFVDEQTPFSVRVAALLMCTRAVLTPMSRLSAVSAAKAGPLLLTSVFLLTLAWLIARLNRLAYWIAVLAGVLWIAVFVVGLSIPRFHADTLSGFAQSGSLSQLNLILAVPIAILLIAGPSRRAPWGISKGFPSMPENAERTALVRPSAMRAIEIGAVLLATVAAPIAYLFFPRPTFQHSISRMTWELPRDIGWSALLIILVADRRWQSLRGKVWAGPWSHQIALAVTLAAGGELLRHTVGMILAAVGVPSGSPRGTDMYASPAAYALYPAAALVSALYEESLFRAYLLDRLAPWVGDAAAIYLSAVCFAAVHGYPPLETGVLFLVGVLYGAVYLKTRSLPALVAAHWIHNMIVWAGDVHP